MPLTFHIKSDVGPRLALLQGEMTEALTVAAKAAAIPLIRNWKTLIKARAYKTGTYMKSIQAGDVTKTEQGVQIEVGSDIEDPPYPEYLEYGTSTMAPRPTARPALEQSKPEIEKEAQEVFKKITEKLVR